MPVIALEDLPVGQEVEWKTVMLTILTLCRSGLMCVLMSLCGSLYIHLCNFLGFLDLDVSFSRLENVSAIIYSNNL